MSKDGIREIRRRVFYIICTLSFLVVSTMIWSNYRNRINLRGQIQEDSVFAMANEVEFKEITSPINVNSLGKITDNDASVIEPYKFSIKNISNETKDFLLYFKSDNNKENVIFNNYIKYRIKKDGEEYSDIRNLAIDGKIYVDRLNPNEESVYSIQYWIDYDVYDSVKDRFFNSKISLINDNNY